MKAITSSILIAAALVFAGELVGQTNQMSAVMTIGRGELSPEKIEEIYVAPGRLTTIVLESQEPVDSLSIGAPILQVDYNRKLNQIQITPVADGGETNMNLRIGQDTYVFLIKVVNDIRVQYLRTFTLVSDSADDSNGLSAAMSAARPLKPAEIDVTGTIKMIDRARRDAPYRNTLPMLRTFAIGRAYQWNDCIVYLAEISQIADEDLLVFKVEWVNRSDKALYLDATQYNLRVANRKVPVLARYQKSLNSTVYPGQHEVVYMFVQGMRLQPDNEWELLLPPDAVAVGRMIR